MADTMNVDVDASKKRKAEDELPEDASQAKKSKSEESMLSDPPYHSVC
jgi:hypothetical protein